MRLIINQSDFQDIIDCVILAVSNKPTDPILGNILICCSEDGTITTTATNLNLTITAKTIGNVENTGIIALPAKLLKDSISNMKGVIEIEYTDNNCNIKHKSGQHKFACGEAEKFPALPLVENTVEFELPAKKLKSALEASLFCASSDEIKLVLTGVNFQLQNNNLEIAATNGHKLSFLSGLVETEVSNISFTVPVKSLVEIDKILVNVDDNSICQILVGENIIEFKLPNINIYSRLLEGDYPKIKQLIPQKFQHEFTVGTKEFEDTLKRILHLAERKNKIAKILWDYSRKEATIHTKVSDIGEAEEIIEFSPMNSGNNNFAIGVNIDYLLDGLKHVETDKLLFRANTKTSPIVITPIGGLLNQLFLVMPVELKDDYHPIVNEVKDDETIAPNPTADKAPEAETVTTSAEKQLASVTKKASKPHSRGKKLKEKMV